MNLATFFDSARASVFSGKIRQEQVDGCNTLIAAMEAAKWPLSWAAYGLATAFHETAATMQPIAEYGKGKGKAYGTPDAKTGQTYYGRGFVQLTWLFNYQKAQKELGYPLVANPDLAMQPAIAAAIMIKGMAEGWFTGKSNKTYLDQSPPDYRNARRIINGMDKADLIAGYAKSFEAALKAAGYGAPEPANTADAVPVEDLPTKPAEPPMLPVPEQPLWPSLWGLIKFLIKGK